MKRTKTPQQAGIGRPVAREIVAPSPARSGMVLLFVVVLLTLLAVMGGAYLVSSRIDNSQVSPTDRGGEANPMGLDAADRIDQIMLKAQDATKRKLFLDAFAYNGIVPANAGTYPNAQRILGDDSGDAGGVNNRLPPTDPTNPNGIIGDGVPDLIWRPTEANRQAVMPVPVAAPADNELGVFTPMGPFGGFTALRGMSRPGATPVPPALYADTVHFPYYHVDALGGTDTHLASRLPIFDNFSGSLATADEFLWPWISGPIVGVPDFPVDNAFVNPFTGNGLSFDDPALADPTRLRRSAIPTTFGPVAYPPPPEIQSLTGNNLEFYNDRLRTWPALAADLNGDNSIDPATEIFPAADADGDGVADSALVPIVFDERMAPPWDVVNNTLPPGDPQRHARWVDPQTGFVYLVGIRIVDNNDAINVNTALARSADVRLPFSATLPGIDLATADYETLFTTDLLTAPNRGIYLSNIGLFELFFQGVDDGSAPGSVANDGFDDTGGGRTRLAQFQLLMPTMLGDPTGSLVANDVATNRPDTQHATLGELLAMNRDRVMDYGIGINQYPNTVDGLNRINPFRSLDEDGMLAFNGGGWLEPEVAPTRLENAAFDALRVAAGNYVPNAKMMFDIFPLGADMGDLAATETEATLRNLWAALFKNADPDITTTGQFATAYPAAGMQLGTRFGGRDWPLSPRAALVTHNGTGQAFRPQTLLPNIDLTTPGLVVQWQAGVDAGGNPVFTGMPPYRDDGTGIPPRPPVRASANTAGFAELWRAFWNVMLEPDFSPAAAGYLGPVPSYVPGQRLPAGDPQNTTERMFRNDYYSGFVANRWFSQTTPLEPPDHYQILTLRAALAAINTLDIRDVEDVRHSDPGLDTVWGTPAPPATDDAHPIPTAADIVLDPTPGSVTGERYLARVAGSEAQPFITEVYVVFDGGGVVQYIGIELHNPYPFELHLQNWYLLGIHGAHRPERWNGNTLSTASIISMTGADFSTPINVTIPANSYVVLQNEPPPPTIILDPTAVTDNRVYTGQALTPGGPSGLLVPSGSGRIQDGAQIIRELLLMRPLDPFSANLGQVATTADQIIAECVPADFFDPSGADPFQVAAPPGTDPAIWRYVRPNDERSWKFVAHGEWRLPAPGEAGTVNFAPVDPLLMTPSLGARDLDTATPPARSIPWGPVLSGPVSVDDDSGTSTPKALYPFGGFARDGDALGIPFFGSYRLYRDFNGDGLVDPLVDHLVELVPPTLDAFFVERLPAGVPPTPTPTTHIGRFIPQGQAFQPTGTLPDQLDEGYNWAADFFEYVSTLYTPAKDYAPHADNRYLNNTAYDPVAGTGNAENALLFNPGSVPVPGSTPTTLFQQPLQVEAVIDNDQDGYANGYVFDTATGTWVPPDPTDPADVLLAYREAFLPVEGQVNLNTASFGILKTLPLAVDPNGNGNDRGEDVNGNGILDPGEDLDGDLILDRGRIAGASPGSPLDGLAGMIYLGRTTTPYSSLLGLNALGNAAAPTDENFRRYTHPGLPAPAPAVSRRAAGDISGFKPLSEDTNGNGVLDPGEDLNHNLTLDLIPSFADLMADTEDVNGNGALDPGEDRNANAALDTESRYFDVGPRDLAASPPDPADYEDDTIQLTRISNLTTLRSDSYTVYIVVQAWENFGSDGTGTTPPARMIRQERSAFIVDRSGILPFNLNSTPPGLPWTPDDINGDAWRDALKITPIPTR